MDDGTPRARLAALPGRDTFLRQVQARLDGATDGGTAVLLVVVEDLQDVHSAYGYAAGDAVLAAVADRVRARRPAGARIGRHGDRVFALLVPIPGSAGGDERAVHRAVQDLRSVWCEPVTVPGGAEVRLTGTTGASFVAAALAGPGAAERLLRDAEIALHRARVTGEPWALYDAGQDEGAGERLRQVAELREAISGDQLEVHYQPVVDMRTGVVVSLEALVRWRHPVRGLVPPDRFIGLAEQSGLIDDVTTYVVAAVARQTRAWAAAGRPLPCAVNLSVHSLVVPEVSERLVAALAPLRGAVTVEVTESAFADQRAVAVLERLAAAGIPCSIDDFGTGYSCLAALKDLPVTTVKIDRSFTKDIDHDDRDVAFVEAILELAGALGLGVIAEGMETEAAAARLVAAGVVRGQGYLYARPMPAADLEVWLAGRPQTPADRAVRDGEQPDPHRAPHEVVFHDGDDELLAALVPYVARGLGGQGHAIVIATPEHVAGLRRALPARQLELAERGGRFLALDAEQTLALFMRDGAPDPLLFEQTVGNLVRAHVVPTGRVDGPGHGGLSAYGEMVAVLWAEGQGAAALALEELWNQLQRSVEFTLLCAYPVEVAGAGLGAICATHSSARVGATSDEDPAQVLLDSARALLRVETSEQVLAVLMRAVTALGGEVVPPGRAPAGAAGLSLGLGTPLLAVAPAGSPARHALGRLLPDLLEDARVAVRGPYGRACGWSGRQAERAQTASAPARAAGPGRRPLASGST